MMWLLLAAGLAMTAVLLVGIVCEQTHGRAERIERLLRRSLRMTRYIRRMEEQHVAAIDELRAEVENTKGVVASGVVAINGLADRLDEIIAGGNQDAALIALRDELRAANTAMAEAIAANPIPPAPEPPPVA